MRIGIFRPSTGPRRTDNDRRSIPGSAGKSECFVREAGSPRVRWQVEVMRKILAGTGVVCFAGTHDGRGRSLIISVLTPFRTLYGPSRPPYEGSALPYYQGLVLTESRPARGRPAAVLNTGDTRSPGSAISPTASATVSGGIKWRHFRRDKGRTRAGINVPKHISSPPASAGQR
jgi:hypothetical protein